jgi:hypothetical protein
MHPSHQEIEYRNPRSIVCLGKQSNAYGKKKNVHSLGLLSQQKVKNKIKDDI